MAVAVEATQATHMDIRDERCSKGSSGSLKRKIHYSADDDVDEEIPQKKLNLVANTKCKCGVAVRERGLSDKTNTFGSQSDHVSSGSSADLSTAAATATCDISVDVGDDWAEGDHNDDVFACSTNDTITCMDDTYTVVEDDTVTDLTAATISTSSHCDECADSNNNTSTTSLTSIINNVRFTDCYKHMGFDMYINNHLDYLLEHEQKTHIEGFLRNQKDISQKKWSSEIHWLIQLNDKYGYHTETIHLAVSLFDRTLSKTPVSPECLKLVAVACFYIASKQEEVIFPSVKQLLRVCKSSYEQLELFGMEREILKLVHFCVHAPTVHHFMEQYVGCKHHPPPAPLHLTADSYDQLLRAKALARFLTLLTIQDYQLVQYKPSLLALAVLQYAFTVLYRDESWPLVNCFHHYQDWQIAEAMRDVERLCKPYIGDAETRIYEYLTEDDINS